MNKTRMLTAGLLAGIEALPDYVRNKWLRRAIIATTATTYVSYLNTDDNPDNDVSMEALDFDGTEDGPLLTWLKISGVVGAVIASFKVDAMIANGLRKRGVRKPHTLLGALVGLLVLFGPSCKK